MIDTFQSSNEFAFYDVSVDWDGLTVRVEEPSQWITGMMSRETKLSEETTNIGYGHTFAALQRLSLLSRLTDNQKIHHPIPDKSQKDSPPKKKLCSVDVTDK